MSHQFLQRRNVIVVAKKGNHDVKTLTSIDIICNSVVLEAKARQVEKEYGFRE